MYTLFSKYCSYIIWMCKLKTIQKNKSYSVDRAQKNYINLFINQVRYELPALEI